MKRRLPLIAACFLFLASTEVSLAADGNQVTPAGRSLPIIFAPGRSAPAPAPVTSPAAAAVQLSKPGVAQNDPRGVIAPAIQKSTKASLQQYLTAARPLIRQYDAILLELIETHVQTDKKVEYKPTAAEIESLQQKMTALVVPDDLADGHLKLMKALQMAQEFVTEGGVQTLGFGKGLIVAQCMHRASDNYQDDVVSAMHMKGVAVSKLPFAGRPLSVSEARGLNGESMREPHSQGSLNYVGSERALSQSIAAPKTSADPYGFINGTDGANGMTGMFNGLGGTGTNGLVDGLGFSSGLNGFLNGMGNSSGMSGMMNDTESGSSR